MSRGAEQFANDLLVAHMSDQKRAAEGKPRVQVEDVFRYTLNKFGVSLPATEHMAAVQKELLAGDDKVVPDF
jgi:hypothetical protein